MPQMAVRRGNAPAAGDGIAASKDRVQRAAGAGERPAAATLRRGALALRAMKDVRLEGPRGRRRRVGAGPKKQRAGTGPARAVRALDSDQAAALARREMRGAPSTPSPASASASVPGTGTAEAVPVTAKRVCTPNNGLA